MGEELRAAILGIIEGLSEFLPISSTGHMILAEPVLGIDGDLPPWPAFLYFIQIGAIAAVDNGGEACGDKPCTSRPEA